MNPDHVAHTLALRRLVDLYGVHADAPDAAAFADLFLPDGTLTSHTQDGTPVVRAGRDQIRREVVVFLDPSPFERTMHLVGNHLCTIDGERAEGLTYCSALHVIAAEDGEDPQLYTDWLRYDDAYVLTADGWRFESRLIRSVARELRPLRATGAAELLDAAFRRAKSGEPA